MYLKYWHIPEILTYTWNIDIKLQFEQRKIGYVTTINMMQYATNNLNLRNSKFVSVILRDYWWKLRSQGTARIFFKKRNTTAQKMKFSIKYIFSECDQIRRKLRIWSNLLEKSLMENFIFCAVDLGAFSKKVHRIL